MKLYLKLAGVFCALIFTLNSYAQTDGCSASPTIPVTATCASPTSGTTAGATQTIIGCVGNADDDVWYQFTATSTTHQITVVGSATFDPVVQLFSGGCSVLNTVSCMDQTFNGGTETIYATGLTIGAVYKIRVYHYSAGSGSNTFTICVTTPPAAPANDNCAGATLLGVNLACTYTNSTSASATQSLVGCAGNADDDVWFRFVATNSVQTITIDPSASMDPVIELFSGTCGTLNSLYCIDNTFTNGNEVISAVGLIPGNTYYVRVYDYYTSTGGAPFQICVTGTATSAPTNDEPCNAIPLPAVTAECTYLNFTTVGATASLGAPTPASCAGGSAPFQGGFNASTADVWFSVVVPASGILSITPQPGYGINDAVMVLYSGTCGALTQIACSDDYNFPGATNDFKPYILQTGLTPGATVYIRYWRFSTNTGIFGLCVSSPTNDNCANALYICDLNGYSASTSAAYTPDRPGTGAGQMFGNNETSAGVNLVDGTNSGGPFGGTTFDVNIENNSWITFTAAATTATLTVSIYNCWVGNFPSGGIQMEIFSGTNCNNFVSVSNFEESSTGFVITATGLTVGQDYYLMVDGYAGDICNYTITANTGVAFPEIIASANPICTGTAITLTAPAGATSYLWSPGGQTTQTINVSPSSTTTYTCVVEGVCGYKQTLTKTITVNQLPNITNPNSSSICSGQTFNMPLTADLTSTFSWIAANNGNTTGESITTQTTSTINNTITNSSGTPQIVNYTVTPTSSNGCVGIPRVVSVTVNPLNTITSGSNQTVCLNSSIIPISMTTTGATGANVTGLPAGVTGTWSSNVITISGAPTVSGTFTYTVTTTGGCPSTTATGTITVTPLNTVATGINRTTCINSAITTITLATTGATGATITGLPAGVTGTWAGNVVTISGTPTASGTFTYTVTTTGGCPPATTTGTITVNPLLNSSFTYPGNTYCQSGTNPTPTITGVAGGTFSGSAGLSINATTGLINLAASTLTSHVVTYTTIGSCPTSSTFNITVTTAPTSGFSYSQPTYCQESADPSVTYVAGASGGVFSATPAGLSINTITGQIDLSSSTPNTYTVTNFIAPSGGCAPSTSTFSVTIFATPTVTAPVISSVCDGTPVTLSGSGNAATYTWNNGITNGVSFTPTSTLTYTVTGLSANSCLNTATTTVTVVPNVTPLFSFGTTASICSGATVPSLPSTSTNGINGTWSPSSVSNTTSNNYVFTPAVGVCALSTNFNVTITSLPQITGTPVSTPSGCNLSNGSLTSVNVTGSPVLIYDWTNSSGNSVGSSSDLVNQPAGNYTLTVTDGNGCESQFGPYSIINPNAPTTPTPIVVNQTCTQSTGSITLTGGFTSYELTGINPVQPLVSNATGVFTNLIPGDYSVFVIDASSCSSAAITVTILNDDLLDCDGDGVTTEDEVTDGTDPNDPCDYLAGSITLTPSGDYLDADCDGDGVTNGDEIADGTDPEDPCDFLAGSITLGPSGDYLTEDCDGDGVTNGDELADGTNPEDPCDYLAGSITLTPSGEFLTTDCDGDGVTNEDEIADGTDPFDPCSFESGSITLTLGGLWNDSDCDGDGVTNGDELADGTDPYDPCSLDELSITLPVTDTTDCDVTIDIPDGFSPNGDLVNDVFVIDNIEYYPKNHFTVLNRWGNIVYETDGYLNTWDGTSQANIKIGGEDLPTGTYFYILDLGEDIEGMERYYKGFIFLNR
jgi:gliding motility-associated-like protein